MKLEDKPFVSAASVGAMLGCSRRTASRFLADNGIEACLPGLYRTSDVLHAMENPSAPANPRRKYGANVSGHRRKIREFQCG